MAEADDRLKRVLEEVLARANDREAASNALSILFPRVERSLQTFVGGSSSNRDLMHASRRIADPESSRVYFSLNLDEGAWTKEDTARLFSAGATKGLSAATRRIKASDDITAERLKRALLDDLAGGFTGTNPLSVSWLVALSQRCRFFVAGEKQLQTDLFSLGNIDRLARAVMTGLRPLSEQERTRVIVAATSRAVDLTLICEVVRSVLGDVRPDGARADRRPELAFGDGNDEARLALLEAVRKEAKRGRIWTYADPKIVLWFWWGSTTDDEVLEFTKREMKTVAGLVGLAEAVTGRTVSTGRGAFYSINESSAGNVVDLDELRQRASGALKSSVRLTSLQRRALENFVGALPRGR